MNNLFAGVVIDNHSQDHEYNAIKYFQDRNKKWPFFTSSDGGDKLRHLLARCTQLLDSLPPVPRATLQQGVKLYGQKPNLRAGGVTWSQQNYRHVGLQVQYIRYKSIQRFTETWSALQRSEQLGLFDWLAPLLADAPLRVASLGGGPGFELTAVCEYLRGRHAAIETVSCDLEVAWGLYATQLGHRFEQWDVNDGATLLATAFPDAAVIDLAVISYVMYHYMSNERCASWLAAALNGGSIRAVLVVSRYEDLSRVFKLLRAANVQIVRLMGDGDDRLSLLLPAAARLTARGSLDSLSMLYPNVPYVDHRKKAKKKRASDWSSASAAAPPSAKKAATTRAPEPLGALASLLSTEARGVLGNALRHFDDALSEARALSALAASGDAPRLTAAALDDVMSGERHYIDNIDKRRRYRNCVWALRVVQQRVLAAADAADKRASPPPPPLLTRACATARIDECSYLHGKLSNLCNKRAPKDAFTRWMLTTRALEATDGGDWLLPTLATRDGGLEHELHKLKYSDNQARFVAEQMAALARQSAVIVCRVAAEPSSARKPSDATRRFIERATNVSAERRAALRERFVGESDAFDERLFCLLTTYGALGGQAREGEGYQGAVTPATFAALQAECRVTGECFASPLNCHLPTFWSAFPAIDRLFGSQGSFFDAGAHFVANGGAYEANPPFLEEHMLAMALALELWLQQCAVPLEFVVFVPQWRDSPYYELLAASKFTRRRLDLGKGKHRYLRGYQHLQTAANKKPEIGYAHTSVFFMQNKAAVDKHPITEQNVANIEKSMLN